MKMVDGSLVSHVSYPESYADNEEEIYDYSSDISETQLHVFLSSCLSSWGISDTARPDRLLLLQQHEAGRSDQLEAAVVE